MELQTVCNGQKWSLAGKELIGSIWLDSGWSVALNNWVFHSNIIVSTQTKYKNKCVSGKGSENFR